MSAPLNPGAPGALVSTAVEHRILDAKRSTADVNEALRCAQDSLQLIGSLRGPAGTLLRPQEISASTDSGMMHLRAAEAALIDALKNVRAAVRLMRGSEDISDED
ncbi:hypothetical protein BBP40_010166 [Aspergillus hancockii]|nr:hypothetical protein BBP40_010166 [Aspergillus hancockii]